MERTRLIDSFKSQIAFSLDVSTLDLVVSTLTQTLNDYDVTKRETQIALRDDVNEKIIKEYFACLLTEGRSNNTIKEYSYIIKMFMSCADKPLNEVSSFDIRRFIADGKLRGLKTTTICNRRNMIKAFYDWMYAEGIIEDNPCRNIGKIKLSKEIRRPFSEVEIESLRRGAKSIKQRAIIEMMLSSGVRVNELVCMYKSDVNLETREVFVREGKGDKQRVTYINDIARHYIGMWFKENNSEYAFPNRCMGMNSVSAVEKMVKRLGNDVGVDDTHPHKFRRTFATEKARKGMPVQDIQRLMGHASISTTMKYISLDDSTVKNSYMRFA